MQLVEKDKKVKTVVICPLVDTESLVYTSLDVLNREEEVKGLVEAMGQAAVFSLSVNVRKIIAKTFFGSGVIERIKEKSLECEAELLVVDHNLSPVQQRNLEKALNLKVIDRTAVILEIFGRRAKTNEGKLQVELAHLTYQRGRLVRSWTHLERQRGGGGFMGGPGETQIELDRRHIDNRILKIKKELEKVKKTRGIQRSARFKVPFPTVALVGYTNAGKSTLFNQLTKADVMAKDMLFATLDPCMRKLTLEKGLDVILSDTVGFISNLPHELVMAFRGTLEEVRVADIILHVIDVSNEGYKKQVEDVWKVLLELGFTDEELSSKYIEIYNKIDKLEDGYDGLEAKIKNGVCVSAVSGEGCQNILKLLAEKLRKKSEIKEIVLDMNDGKELAKMYEKYEVLKRVDDIDKGVILLLVRG